MLFNWALAAKHMENLEYKFEEVDGKFRMTVDEGNRKAATGRASMMIRPVIAGARMEQ